ncbi:MAG: membrane protein insertase YidC [Parachlamydia sp.]|nr:membrane protein insertase YidC [Parachlamydia sp.]
MEKRTVLFFIAVALSFFVVNFFFQYQNKEKMETWKQQQSVRKSQKIRQLESDIAQRTAKEGELPLMDLYVDQDSQQLLTAGVLDQHSILTLSWQETAPKRIFARKSGSQEKSEEYHLIASPEATGVLIYTSGLPEKLLVAHMPDFGKFDLQLVSLYPKKPKVPFRITVGDYVDGHFSLPIVQMQKLRQEIEEEGEKREELRPANGIILLKTVDGFLPVALYDSKTNTATALDEIENLADLVTKPKEKIAITSGALLEEKFYVLENDYQQLVFSNYGGSLAEINLPFPSAQNTLSVVRPIEYDREMVEQNPANAHFPAHPYYTPGKAAEGPYEEHIEGKLGGYYPLIRRDLIDMNRRVIRLEPRFYALNLVSEYPEMAQLVFKVKSFDKKTIVFEASQSNRRITKTYSIAVEEKGAPYCVELTLQIEGDSRGLWLTSGVPEVEIISGSPAPSLKYRITRKQRAEVEPIDLPKDALTNTSLFPDWISNSNGFLGVIQNPISTIDPGFRAQRVSGTEAPSRLTAIESQYQRFKAQDLPGYMTLLPLNGKGGTMKFHIFAGPYADDILKAVDSHYSDSATGYNPDFIASQTFHGWFSFISEPFAKVLFILMNFFHSLTGSWALSIVLLTVALRLMLYPLNAWSTKSMLRMQQVGPEVTAIQEKYKKDPKKAQLEIMQLYRDRKINPMSGCLPLLIQMPFLIGMFDLLKSTFELRGASFIPGWIDNLTAPDVLFSWKTPIWFIGNQFHLLPIILGIVMFFQQRMMSTLPKDPNLWTEQQRQQRAMGSMMTLVFTVMFYHFPSGLNIYWLSSLLLGMLQQWWMQRQLKGTALEPKKA